MTYRLRCRIERLEGFGRRRFTVGNGEIEAEATEANPAPVRLRCVPDSSSLAIGCCQNVHVHRSSFVFDAHLEVPRDTFLHQVIPVVATLVWCDHNVEVISFAGIQRRGQLDARLWKQAFVRTEHPRERSFQLEPLKCPIVVAAKFPSLTRLLLGWRDVNADRLWKIRLL